MIVYFFSKFDEPKSSSPRGDHNETSQSPAEGSGRVARNTGFKAVFRYDEKTKCDRGGTRERNKSVEIASWPGLVGGFEKSEGKKKKQKR